MKKTLLNALIIILVIACNPALAQQTAKDQAVVPGVKSMINFQVNGQGDEVICTKISSSFLFSQHSAVFQRPTGIPSEERLWRARSCIKTLLWGSLLHFSPLKKA